MSVHNNSRSSGDQTTPSPSWSATAAATSKAIAYPPGESGDRDPLPRQRKRLPESRRDRRQRPVDETAIILLGQIEQSVIAARAPAVSRRRTLSKTDLCTDSVLAWLAIRFVVIRNVAFSAASIVPIRVCNTTLRVAADDRAMKRDVELAAGRQVVGDGALHAEIGRLDGLKILVRAAAGRQFRRGGSTIRRVSIKAE